MGKVSATPCVFADILALARLIERPARSTSRQFGLYFSWLASSVDRTRWHTRTRNMTNQQARLLKADEHLRLACMVPACEHDATAGHKDASHARNVGPRQDTR